MSRESILPSPLTASAVRSYIDFDGLPDDVGAEPSVQAQLQSEGVAGLWELMQRQDFAYLADEVGMGKTRQAMGVIATQLLSRPDSRIVIVCSSATLQRQWQSEWSQFLRTCYRLLDDRLLSSVDGAPLEDLHMHQNLREFAHALRAGESRIHLLRYSSFSRPLSLDKSSPLNMLEDYAECIGVGDVDALDAAERWLATLHDGRTDGWEDRMRHELAASWFRRIGLLLTHGTQPGETGADEPRLPLDLVIFDEAQYLRHTGNFQNTHVAQVFRRNVRHWLFLSATPLHSNSHDIRSLDAYGVAGAVGWYRNPERHRRRGGSGRRGRGRRRICLLQDVAEGCAVMSLEALLCNRGTSVRALFERLTFFVVDELHAFIGSERGKQLQSLMHRVERAIGRTVPRIGLSATLGDMGLAAEYLRPNKGGDVALVVSSSGAVELKILVKGYEEPASVRPAIDEGNWHEDDEQLDEQGGGEADEVSPALIAAHLFSGLRGSNNLVFPNARREVERYTHLLNGLCTREQVPNEFWPHHGSLSKEIRAETEAALKARDRPATAICTNTLELGIDIGAVKSVAQIGPPPSVASLRQRLGRSGRRKGEPAILRGYCIEEALGPGISLASTLRLDLVRMAAMISLLAEGWFEPPVSKGTHYSTLVQQMLSFVAQNGGATIGDLYKLLCPPGAPFFGVTKDEFMELVRHLGQQDLLMQESSGLLLHGQLGERFVNHYTFYAAFAVDEEYRLVAAGKTLGTLPVSQMLTSGQRILFAGKTWVVEAVDDQQKTIFVTRTRGGVPPLFSGGAGRTHTRVRQRMRDLLESSEAPPAYLDATGKRFLKEARAKYASLRLKEDFVIDQGRELLLVTWLGDAANEAIACILRFKGLAAHATAIGIEVRKLERSTSEVVGVVVGAGTDDVPELDRLLADAKNLRREKWDWALPNGLVRKAYASLFLNLEEGLE
jgi:ATP-dependent Lhr-like helicase